MLYFYVFRSVLNIAIFILQLVAFVPIFFILATWYNEPLALSLDFFSFIAILSIIYIILFITSIVIRLRTSQKTTIDKVILKSSFVLSLGFFALLAYSITTYHQNYN